MYCGNCGKRISNTGAFCPECGQLVNASKQRKHKVPLLIWVALLLTIFAIGILGYNRFASFNGEAQAGIAYKIEGEGFDSAEDALFAYLEAMQAGDVKAMISTFAVETYVDHFDVVAQAKKAGGYSTSMVQPIISKDDYTRAININLRENDIIQSLLAQYFYFAGMYELYGEVTSYTDFYGFGSPQKFFDTLQDDNWMETLSDLKYGDILSDEYLRNILPVEYYSESTQKVLIANSSVLGCDEYVSLAVNVEFDSKEYIFSMDIIRYGDKWFNYRRGMISDFLGSHEAFGFIEK